ncbi:nitric-oxide reductase large subunit [Haloarchaeobius amylolyticus]|uniref:nitric-oxide reductase large subunit n=1 Tax=Haloarchaeobius amylolyticus TaxID=1198296 RepID=UPI0022700367|nr:cbb3-type cytochrome c oxidase subunit I [Haloarchaeobius amylolyticus]
MKVRRQTLAKLLVIVFVVNLAVMGVGAWYSTEKAPPIPKEVVGPDGEQVVTDEQVRTGKTVFQSDGMMNHGSILGNGAYYGVDYTADALDLKVQYMREYYARERHGEAYADLSSAEQAAIGDVVKTDLDDGSVDETIHYSAAEVYAHQQVREVYVERYHEGSAERGVPEGMVASEEEARRFADFAMWTAWMSHTDRPASDHSYTNDWPYQPAAGNDPGAAAMTWSVIAMVLLVAGAGAGVWLYKSVDLPEPSTAGIDVPAPDEADLLPSQSAALKFVPVAALLFVGQVLLGGLLAHYYVERHAFFGIESVFGIPVIELLPFALAKTWHIDLGVLWIATLWLGAGLFLAPLLTGYEPKNQSRYVYGLLGALVVVVVGGLTGIYLGANEFFQGDLWWLLGNEGLEYLEVGKVWQFGLLLGFGAWAVLVARGFRPLLDREPKYGLAHMILYAGGSIGLLFVAGFMFTPQTNIAVTEFWRWWVVHMWVEGAFEFFIVAIVGLTLVSMNLLKKQSAEKAVMLEALLVMGTGVIGVSHHYWWIGMPDVWVPIGSVFSTLELIPLVFILYEALNEYQALSASGEDFPYRLPFMFIIASGVWNFVGAGVLGFFINLPLVNYYEHGTYLTVGHAHAAMFGAFGFLALGMATYMLRIATKDWDASRLRVAFWTWNVGLALMVFVSVLPVGFLQLEAAFTANYDAARSLAFYNGELVQLLFWARLPGDTLLIVGTLVFAYDVVVKLFGEREVTTEDQRDAVVAARMGADDD